MTTFRTKAEILSEQTGIPVGLCQCGCGKQTTMATEHSKKRGWRLGEPHAFLRSHPHRLALCKVCGVKAKAKGLCSMHYQRFLKDGSSGECERRQALTVQVCRVAGCMKSGRRRGLCDVHHGRLKKFGQVDRLVRKHAIGDVLTMGRKRRRTFVKLPGHSLAERGYYVPIGRARLIGATAADIVRSDGTRLSGRLRVVTCPCGENFVAPLGSRQRFHDRACYDSARRPWQGQVYMSKAGEILVFAPRHCRANKRGWVGLSTYMKGSTMTWKQTELELKQIRSATLENAYKTAKGIATLFADAAFLTDCGESLDARDKRLSQYSGVFALGPDDMRLMIEFFPDYEANYPFPGRASATVSWKQGRLDLLRDAALLLYNQQRSKARDTKKPATTADGDDLAGIVPPQKRNKPEALLTIIRREHRKAEAMEEEVSRLKRELQDAKAKLQDAVHENASLRSRLTKLSSELVSIAGA